MDFRDRGGIEFSADGTTVRVLHRSVRLTPRDYRVLQVLVERRGRVISREDLLELVTGEKRTDVRTVDVWVRRLRAALVRGDAPDPITSVRSVGYLFREDYERALAEWTRHARTKIRFPEPQDS